MKILDNKEKIPGLPSLESPYISVIIVSWNTCGLTCRCLGSVITALNATNVSYEIILVDNSSDDGTV